VLGIIAAGGVFTGTNPGYTSHEVSHHLKTARARFLIVEPTLLKTIQHAQHSIASKHIFIFDPLDSADSHVGYTPWTDLLNHGEADWVRLDDLETSKNTTAMLLFSSGTTGLPKAAMISHYNLIAEHHLTWEDPVHPRDYDVRRLVPLPLFHAASAPVTHTTPLRNGDVTYIMRRFDTEMYLKFVELYQITGLSQVDGLVSIYKH
jgi:4-coumarate--CoA ligase